MKLKLKTKENIVEFLTKFGGIEDQESFRGNGWRFLKEKEWWNYCGNILEVSKICESETFEGGLCGTWYALANIFCFLPEEFFEPLLSDKLDKILGDVDGESN